MFLSSVIQLDFERRHAQLFATENTGTLLKSSSKSPSLNEHEVCCVIHVLSQR